MHVARSKSNSRFEIWESGFKKSAVIQSNHPQISSKHCKLIHFIQKMIYLIVSKMWLFNLNISVFGSFAEMANAVCLICVNLLQEWSRMQHNSGLLHWTSSSPKMHLFYFQISAWSAKHCKAVFQNPSPRLNWKNRHGIEPAVQNVQLEFGVGLENLTALLWMTTMRDENYNWSPASDDKTKTCIVPCPVFSEDEWGDDDDDIGWWSRD